MINQSEYSEPSRVTIEDLLRLKRAERPSPEFWTRFEQDLRAKQLAAIMEKRPWWIVFRLPRAARVLSRLQVPVGAAAVLALSFVVAREFRSSATMDPVSAPALNTVEAVPASRAQLPAVAAPIAKDAIAAPRAVVAVVSGDAVIGATSSQPDQLMPMIPWAAPQSGSISEEASRADPIGELPQVHFASVVNPGSDHDFDRRVELVPVDVSVALSPAHELAVPARVSPVSPREMRRNRILSTLVVADNSSESDRSRLAQIHEGVESLDDDRLYDSVRRLGMGGDRLTLKF